MTELENGGNEGRRQAAAGGLKKPQKPLAFLQRGPEGALFRSSSLTVVSFLIHILFLLFVDPANYPYISALLHESGIIFRPQPLTRC
jgi:hypothetical protein